MTTSARLRLAIVGPGAIGSTLAYRLTRAGHDVTVIARGARLAELERDRAIVNAAGRRATVHVSAALDPTIAWDLVLVTVLAEQTDTILPTLVASRAQTVMFLFNTFASLAPLREAVGADRFAFGFPAIVARLADGKLTSKIVTHGLLTTVTAPRWAELFAEARIPTVVETDMESWLRAHAALIVPVMTVTRLANARHAGVSWAEARCAADAMAEGFDLVRRLGHPLTPTSVAALSHVPTPLVATALWTLSRSPEARRLGARAPDEPRALIDAMLAASGSIDLPALRAIRP